MTLDPETEIPAEVNEKDLELPENEDDLRNGYIPEVDSVSPKVLNMRLVTQPFDFVIDTIISQIDNKTLILDPPYQRNYVWDNSRASQLIESLLINIPIPACYFAEEEIGTYTVVDGQQRLRSIWRFIKGEFELQGLGTLNDREGQTFQKLSERDQRLIRGRTIRCIVISQESDPEIRFEVFKRLNRRPMPLSDQEIRNAIYRGDFNDLIKNLADQDRWLKALHKKKLDKRMRDDELVVRFFALHDSYKDYQAPLGVFLDSYMRKKGKTLSEAEKARLTQLFEKTVDIVIDVFDDHAFRSYDKGWERQVNRALFDAVMLVFSHLPKEKLVAQRKEINKALRQLCGNKDFFQAISRSTADRNSMFTRIRLFSEAMAGIGLKSGIHESLPS